MASSCRYPPLPSLSASTVPPSDCYGWNTLECDRELLSPPHMRFCPPAQHLYVCGNPAANIQTHYIHVVIWGQQAWNNYINLRDYLNSHEEKAKEYAALKEHLAKEYPENRIAYTSGKSAFIEEILQMAAAWRQLRGEGAELPK